MSNSLTIYRTGTANLYDQTRLNLTQRQNTLTQLQESLTSGKRVNRPSDDPVAAAQAERAITRLSRVATDQRALEVQRNAVAQAETTLGDAVSLVQNMREIIVASGSGTLKPEDRKTYANQLQNLREQLVDVINRKDTNGLPLLSALGSQSTLFTAISAYSDFTFNGQPGQSAATNTTVPLTLDGHSAFMFEAQRDGVYNAAISNSNPAYLQNGRRFDTDAVQVTNANLLEQPPLPTDPQYTYSVTFTGTTLNADGTYDATYDISSTNPNYTSPGPQTVSGLKADKLATIPISITEGGGATLKFNITATPTKDSTKASAWDWSSPEGQAIEAQYAAYFSASVPLSAADRAKIPPPNFVLSPAPGDTVTITPTHSLGGVIDAAIRDIGGAGNNNAASQAVGQALANIDKGLERLHHMRGYAGELLNRADRITGDQENRSIQLEADRSRAEDLDMIKGISEFQNAQVGYQAALQSYAQVQKLSLFNYIS